MLCDLPRLGIVVVLVGDPALTAAHQEIFKVAKGPFFGELRCEKRAARASENRSFSFFWSWDHQRKQLKVKLNMLSSVGMLGEDSEGTSSPVIDNEHGVYLENVRAE